MFFHRQIFRHFSTEIFETATWCGSSFDRTFAIGLPLRCPLEQIGAKPQILLIFGPNRNKFSAAVPQLGEKLKI